MSHGTVFVVSGDAAVRDSVAELAASAGLRAEAFPSLEIWLGAVGPARHGCLVLDARPRDLAGPGTGERFASICEVRSVLLLVDRGDVPVAVRAIREGAVDVVEKPYRRENLLERIKRATAEEDAGR
jgi:FixJ family two-component response regulator